MENNMLTFRRNNSIIKGIITHEKNWHSLEIRWGVQGITYFPMSWNQDIYEMSSFKWAAQNTDSKVQKSAFAEWIMNWKDNVTANHSMTFLLRSFHPTKIVKHLFLSINTQLCLLIPHPSIDQCFNNCYHNWFVCMFKHAVCDKLVLYILLLVEKEPDPKTLVMRCEKVHTVTTTWYSSVTVISYTSIMAPPTPGELQHCLKHEVHWQRHHVPICIFCRSKPSGSTETFRETHQRMFCCITNQQLVWSTVVEQCWVEALWGVVKNYKHPQLDSTIWIQSLQSFTSELDSSVQDSVLQTDNLEISTIVFCDIGETS
jgi:hypothetical protein